MNAELTSAERELARLAAENVKLRKINAALMSRVERAMDQPNNAFGLFEVAITLDQTVRRRTAEVQAALRSVEGANEALLRAKQQAELANAFKSSFLAFVSHDLLQPLNAARLNVSTLMEAVPTDEVRRFASQIDLAMNSLEDLIRTLLDMSKLDAGAMRPEIAAFDLEQVLSPLRVEFAPLAASRGLKLKLRSSHVAVRSDPLLLRRILQNLLNNALRYTRRGGVLLGARRRGEFVRIEVSDTGPGIPSDRREAIFEEFRREGGGERDGGFGLGLSIVRRLAQALDHSVDLASRVGFGSTFAVGLPLASVPDDAPLQPHKQPPVRLGAIHGAHVLLIENEPSVAQAMLGLLKRWDCRVALANSCAEAEAALCDDPSRPDLIIADYHLDDGANGLDAIDRVQKALGAPPVPACIVTADRSERVNAAVAARGLELLRKPVKPAELRSLMAYLLA